jgi:drug/metabolite transporter (DMT)-like permease
VRLGSSGVRDALFAAVVFGATTPLSKRLGVDAHPQIFAGLLYLGSGVVLGASLVIWPTRKREASLQRSDVPALAGAVVFGGVIAPILLLIGLKTTAAASASLLLNLEAVFTALGAWIVVREHADRRVIAGMVAIVAGGVLLSIQPSGGFKITAGTLGIVGACASWGIDNVITRPLSLRDPRQVASVKGLVAGTANVAMGLLIGGVFPSTSIVFGALTVGFVGYGLSLVFSVRAMRVLGTARTGAYYGAAPFVGVAVSLVWLREPVGALFLPALVLMAIGLGLHLTEAHRHAHRHSAMPHEHGHDHTNDAHHQHVDNEATSPNHPLRHSHPELTHDHDHTPDEHHRHRHSPPSV